MSLIAINPVECRSGSQLILLQPPATLLHDPTNKTVFSGGVLVYSSRADVVFFFYANPGAGFPPGTVSYLKSTDDGCSWSSSMTPTGPDGKAFTSSGFVSHGIELMHGPHPGRLVISREIFQRNRITKTSVLYSDDNGNSWQAGGSVPLGSGRGESTITELHNGSLLISTRDTAPSNACNGTMVCRSFSRSDSAGESWDETWHFSVDELPVRQVASAMISIDHVGNANPSLRV